MATKTYEGSRYNFGKNDNIYNKVWGYLHIDYTVDATNRCVTYSLRLGAEGYPAAAWVWGNVSSSSTQTDKVLHLYVDGVDKYTSAKSFKFSKNIGFTKYYKDNASISAKILDSTTVKNQKIYYDATGKASIKVAFTLAAGHVYNEINGLYYNITSTLKETTFNFPSIDPLSASITKLPAEWNINDPLEMTIDNPAGLALDVELVCNDISLIKRSQITLTDNKYIFTLTDDERKLIYTEVPDAAKATFEIRLRTHIETSRYVEKDYGIKLTYPTKAWVKVDNTWKRAFVWAKINGTWKQCFPWVKVDGTWKRV